MTDPDCVAFLQWALPRIGLHWPGFRKVRGQVCKRIDRRTRELGLADTAAYRSHLEAHREELAALSALCTVSISRFYRDRFVFDALAARVLPRLAQTALARGAKELCCWSAGCASGEEAYTLSLLWHLRPHERFPALGLRVLGTDLDATLLERARAACYKAGSLEELPADWRVQAFDERDGLFCLRREFRRGVEFIRQDLRAELPEETFDLVLCRNLILTYFSPDLRRDALRRMVERLRPGGALVVGLRERLPEGAQALAAWPGCRATYRFESDQVSRRDPG